MHIPYDLALSRWAHTYPTLTLTYWHMLSETGIKIFIVTLFITIAKILRKQVSNNRRMN